MRSFKNMCAAVLLTLLIAHFTEAQIVVKVKPDRPKTALVKTKQPKKSMVWIEGHWIVKNNKYRWVNGFWVKERPNLVWISGHWKKVKTGWQWIPGHWKKIHFKKQL